MATAKRTEGSAQVFREFAWNIVRAISTGKGTAKSGVTAKRKPAPKHVSTRKRGRK